MSKEGSFWIGSTPRERISRRRLGTVVMGVGIAYLFGVAGGGSFVSHKIRRR